MMNPTVYAIWQMLGWGLVLFGLVAMALAILENKKGEQDTVTIDMAIPGEKHYYEWLSGGAEKGELLEAVVLQNGFTDFYRLEVIQNQVKRRFKIDTVAFPLKSKDFPAIARMMRNHSRAGV